MASPSSLNGDHHLVLPRKGPLVVFFSGTNKANGSFDFRGIAERIDASVILLNNGENRWYQNGVPGFGDSIEGTAHLLRAWAEYLNASEVVCIGASMGGSAAVMFGSLISSRVLAFSFEAHLRHIGSRSRKYIPHDYDLPFEDLCEIIERSEHRVVSILGSDDVIDMAEASRLKRVSNLTLKILRSVDHGVPRWLRNHGLLDDVVIKFVFDASLPCFLNEIDDWTSEYCDLVRLSHESYLVGDVPTSVASAREALVFRPSSYCANFLLGQALAKGKDFDSALAPMAIAVHLAPPDDVASRLILGRILRNVGRLENAALLHKETLLRFPTAHRVHYDLALCQRSLGRYDEARESISNAIKFGQDLPNYLTLHSKIAQITK